MISFGHRILSGIKGGVFCEIAHYEHTHGFPFLVFVLDDSGGQHSQWYDNEHEATVATEMFYNFGAGLA